MKRFAFIALAFGGTALYAASFALLAPGQRPEWLQPLAIGVAVASAVSWPFLGIMLRAASKDRDTLARWFDACLATIAFGEAWLLAAAGWNLLASFVAPSLPVLLGVHLALLLGADATMCAVFTRRGGAIGMRPRVAAGLWIFAMNGVFLFLLALLAGPLGYLP